MLFREKITLNPDDYMNYTDTMWVQCRVLEC